MPNFMAGFLCRVPRGLFLASARQDGGRVKSDAVPARPGGGAMGQYAIDDEQRTPLGFHVKPAEIFPEHPQYKELSATEDKHESHEAGPTLRGAAGQPSDQGVNQQKQSNGPKRRAA